MWIIAINIYLPDEKIHFARISNGTLIALYQARLWPNPKPRAIRLGFVLPALLPGEQIVHLAKKERDEELLQDL
jgi:hypothetical protein